MCDGLDWIRWMVTLKAISGWDWIGLDGMGWLSYTAVTPRASLQSDANNNHGFRKDVSVVLLDHSKLFSACDKIATEPSGAHLFI